MATPTPPTWAFLERRPGSFYRQLFVRGTRIRARILYGHFVSREEPRTPEEMAANYGLPLEAVKEAIAYCQTDPPEIADDFRREEARVRSSASRHGPQQETPEPLPAQEPTQAHNL